MKVLQLRKEYLKIQGLKWGYTDSKICECRKNEVYKVSLLEVAKVNEKLVNWAIFRILFY